MEKDEEMNPNLKTSDVIESNKFASDDGSDGSKIMFLNDNKAGMEGLDKESINRIIYEASKGSLYYENEQRKDALLKARIENQLKHVKEVTQEQLEANLQKANLMIESLELERDLSRVVVHIDMDAFYASVEVLSKPHLRDVPMAVGSNSMLSTSNYAARRFGVRAGMPGFIGKKLCPNLVILPTNFDEYRRYSSMFGQVLSIYDPNYSKMGLDEAYLDITDYINERVKQSHPGQEVKVGVDLELEVVDEMRRKIFELTNLTSSAGIAPNSMLAKVCSDINKPNGQFRIDRSKEAIFEFIKDLPIRKISGIGKVSEQMLKSLEISTCSQLVEKRALLCHLNSPSSFEHYMRVGLGIGYGQVERTFEDTEDLQQLTNFCKNLCQNLVEDLVKENLATKTITLKIKEITFQVKTRAKTLTSFTQNFDIIFGAALGLLKTEVKNSGVRASALIQIKEIPRSKQKSLFDILKKQNSIGTSHDDHFCEDPPPNANKHLFLSSMSSSDTINNSYSDISSDKFPSKNISTTNNIGVDVNTNAIHETIRSICSEQDSTLSAATCPVCNVVLPNDYQSINKHLDECLSNKYIKEVLQNATLSTTSQSSKHQNCEGPITKRSHPHKAPQKRKKEPQCHKTPSLNKFFRPL